MYEKLLPIGSVVLLRGGSKRVMIMGYIATMEGGRDIYDYTGCLYPEGVIDDESVSFFNHDDIERVYFIGFQDGEQLKFRGEVLAGIGELYVDEEGHIQERKEANPEAYNPEAYDPEA